MYKIIFYKDKNGNSELLNYINTLNSKSNIKDCRIKLNKIYAYLNKLSEQGISIGEPFIKHLENDIWELRPLKDRILFAYYNNVEFMLLSYFVKKTKKTPRRELIKAKTLFEEYKKRGKEDDE